MQTRMVRHEEERVTGIVKVESGVGVAIDLKVKWDWEVESR